ncbi:complex I 24 kDa subunit family protein [Kallotenue papyrolyticum]|uniref:complex I 24 kDa subunit family protein n=1 Tax=Kallotenue papyrolyticum TaxID=1325125 RepID=UPI0004B1F323|nr:NAD(P)H-dependent oxidoreductase subunit E [Kallotenue papyrolyticum]
MLKEKYADEIAALLARYPVKTSAVLPLCYLAQDEYGYLGPEQIQEVADILEMPYTDVYEVVTFYSLLYDQPVGAWVLQVCDDNPCCFTGTEELIAELEQRLGIRAGETTSDGMFTLQRVKCIGACHRAPVMQANLEFFYDITPDKVPALLDELRQRAARGERMSISGRFAEQ